MQLLRERACSVAHKAEHVNAGALRELRCRSDEQIFARAEFPAEPFKEEECPRERVKYAECVTG